MRRNVHACDDKETDMLATILLSPGEIRCEEVEDPQLIEPTDAIIKLSASCICGSDPGIIAASKR